ncbi:hypothetical protein K469DRAFT_697684 [Zopfia rhizophila CBS 207.26]|uniref:Fibroin-3 related protein n=1 Tax=Zopfia rhizophila CBS 207.26 TaxID=1314779 RepID=A0A6A6EGJ5_9PEZI|nr:hypothetical protein K469DRAFT_697684 [Zopfia rhizophila CBS 207.26]
MPYLLSSRDPFAGAKDTLSSWDKCMAKTYCKWPVIVAIVVGSLIILSVILCVARCICCGAECACCCFKCCTCCCPSGSRSGHRRMKSAQAPPPVYPSTFQSAPPIDSRPINQQYRSHAAPAFTPAPALSAAREPERPQFATFESPSKPVNEDALPHMPDWRDAKSMQVEEIVVPEKKGDMEMDRLDQNGSVTNFAVTGAAAVGGAGRSPVRSPVRRSPTNDSYGFPAGYSQNDSFVSSAPQRSPRNSPGPYGGRYGQQQDNYRGVSPVQSLSPVYGAGGYSQNQQHGRRSPNAGYNGQYAPPSQGRSPVSPLVNRSGHGASNNSREILDMPSPGMHQNNNFAPAPAARSNSPAYAPSGSTRHDPPAASYPGQQTYEAADSAYRGQQTYQAYQPAQELQFQGVTRKPVDGSWKDV